MDTQTELTEEQKAGKRQKRYVKERARRKAVRHATKVRRGKK